MTILKYDFNMYNPAVIQTALTEKEARKEYSRLRQIANKRLKTIGKSKYARTDVYSYNVGQYITIAEMESPAELYYRLSMVARFLSSERSSLRGLRRAEQKAIETLKSHGYDFINASNYLDFYEFMETVRATEIGSKYDSERVAELFDTAQRKRLPIEELQEDFELWINNLDRLKSVTVPRRKNKRTSAEYRKRLAMK